jgi:predicted nucleotidyltransferase
MKFILDNDKLAIISELCIAHNVRTLYVFGSVCTDKFNEHSDIDILVSFKELSVAKYTDSYFALHDDLEKLLGRKIDLVTENSLSNPYFIQRVEETKQLLYAT